MAFLLLSGKELTYSQVVLGLYIIGFCDLYELGLGAYK